MKVSQTRIAELEVERSDLRKIFNTNLESLQSENEHLKGELQLNTAQLQQSEEDLRGLMELNETRNEVMKFLEEKNDGLQKQVLSLRNQLNTYESKIGR